MIFEGQFWNQNRSKSDTKHIICWIYFWTSFGTEKGDNVEGVGGGGGAIGEERSGILNLFGHILEKESNTPRTQGGPGAAD